MTALTRSLPRRPHTETAADLDGTAAGVAGEYQLILVGCRNASWRTWSSWPTKALNVPSR